MQRAAGAHSFQIALQLLDARRDAPPVRFEFCFAGTARADSAAQPRQRDALAGEPRQHVFQLRQFHLQTPFSGARAAREYIENQLRAVDDLDADRRFPDCAAAWA